MEGNGGHNVPTRGKRSTSGTEKAKGWTAVGVTVHTKHRLIALKKAFEVQLGRGPITWDFFFESLFNNLGLLTWHFLIGQTVRGLKAEDAPCPLPQTPQQQAQEETG
jgi:hypothetical protein